MAYGVDAWSLGITEHVQASLKDAEWGSDIQCWVQKTVVFWGYINLHIHTDYFCIYALQKQMPDSWAQMPDLRAPVFYVPAYVLKAPSLNPVNQG
jgi:hypothetical protein